MILSIVSSIAFVLFCVACGFMAVLFMTYLLTKPFGKLHLVFCIAAIGYGVYYLNSLGWPCA